MQLKVWTENGEFMSNYINWKNYTSLIRRYPRKWKAVLQLTQVNGCLSSHPRGLNTTNKFSICGTDWATVINFQHTTLLRKKLMDVSLTLDMENDLQWSVHGFSIFNCHTNCDHNISNSFRCWLQLTDELYYTRINIQTS